MTSRELRDAMDRLIVAPWPYEVDVDVTEGLGGCLLVDLRVGQSVHPFKVDDPLTEYQVAWLLAMSEQLASSAREAAPVPAWLSSALSRVNAALPSRAGARVLAANVLRALECDLVPAPEVFTDRGEYVVTRWSRAGRVTEFRFKGADDFDVSWSGPGLRVVSSYKAGTADWGVAVPSARLAVAWVYDQAPTFAAEMFALCEVRTPTP